MDTQIRIDKYTADRQPCIRCGSTLRTADGIWRALRPGRAEELDGAVSAYEGVRIAEGRWSEEPEFYLALPWRDSTRRFDEQWKIRARSFRLLRDRLLPARARIYRRPLRILDIGAGNGWLSYRLAKLGHLPVAVDLSVNRLDGLGAARHFREALGRMFPRFQAEMNWLPFAAGQFDLAIFNASLHYAQDYEGVLIETLRVLNGNGAVLIVDSPTYRNEADGEAMRREKAANYRRAFGTERGNMGGEEYLTPARLASLERIGIRWHRYSAWYGLRWALRPMMARIGSRRPPSQFHIHLGTRADAVAEAK
jgi:SAM-dependent methyltransferase